MFVDGSQKVVKMDLQDTREIPGEIETLVIKNRIMYVRWAPGNGRVYTMFSSHVGGDVSLRLGGDLLVSLCLSDGVRFVSYPGSNDSMYTFSYVVEKWGSFMDEESLCYYTVLLNWYLCSGDDAKDYALGVYSGTRQRWS